MGNQFYDREVATCDLLDDDDNDGGDGHDNDGGDGDDNDHNDGQVHEQMSKKNQHTSFYAFFNIEDERTTSNQKWWQKVLNMSSSVVIQIEGCLVFSEKSLPSPLVKIIWETFVLKMT